MPVVVADEAIELVADEVAVVLPELDMEVLAEVVPVDEPVVTPDVVAVVVAVLVPVVVASIQAPQSNGHVAAAFAPRVGWVHRLA